MLSKNKKLHNARGRVAAKRDHFSCPCFIPTKIKNNSHHVHTSRSNLHYEEPAVPLGILEAAN